MKKIKIGAMLLVVAAMQAACAVPASPGAQTAVRLPMGYIPNVQYAPFYVAVERGYFAQEGIAIEFDYKFETDGVKLVAANQLPFAVVSGEQVVLARDKGLPVKYVGQWYHKFPVAVVSLASSGITKPQDLKGRRVGLPGFFGAAYVGWRAFLSANGLKETDVLQEDIGFTQVAALQSGKVDAVVGYANNEPVVLRQNGLQVNVFAVSDYVNMVANGLLTNEQTIKDNPQLVRGMLKALMRGLSDVIANPDEAMRVSAKHVDGLKADDPVQRQVLEASVAMMRPVSGRLGETADADWSNTQRTLISIGQVQQAVDVKSYYTNDFLP